MKHCIFDIETAPLAASHLMEKAPKFSAPANWKDKEKIRANIEEQKKAWVSKAALSPLTGSVCALGILADGRVDVWMTALGYTEEDILNAFWDRFSAEVDRVWIGHNIAGFDVPFLVKRSLMHSIRVPWRQVFTAGNRYLSDCFIDTMKAFQCGDYHSPFIGLDNLADFLGVNGKTDDIGTRFSEVMAEDPDRALNYLVGDLQCAYEVAKRMYLI